MVLVMGVLVGVSATALGIKKTRRLLGSRRGQRDARLLAEGHGEGFVVHPFISVSRLAISWPSLSTLLQRWMLAMQSADGTAVPSCHFSPSRSAKV